MKSINIISNLYVNVNTNKSFREFYSFFHHSRPFSNNYIITDDYIIFDNIKPTIYEDLERQYLTLQEFYKYSKNKKRLNNITSLYFYKFQTITKISIKKEEKILNIYNPYKELARTINYPIESNKFTHLMTITYRYEATAKRNSTNEIFELMRKNKEIRDKVNKGIHRMRTAIAKVIRDDLKKKIKNKNILNKKVRETMNKIFRYFKVYELHKSNQIHAHFLIQLPRFITQMEFTRIIEKIANWFETDYIGVDLKRLKTGNDNNRARRYVIKYLNKQFTNDNLFYVENEINEKIYFIKKEAIIRNDIPRMTSKSRNVKTKKYKPYFTITEEKATKEHADKEIIRLENPITRKEASEFNEILKKFKTRKHKEVEREYKEEETRTEILEKMELYLDGKYFSIKEISKAIDYGRTDKIIQKFYNTIYQKVVIKFNKDMKELEEIINEYDNDQDDWIDF